MMHLQAINVQPSCYRLVPKPEEIAKRSICSGWPFPLPFSDDRKCPPPGAPTGNRLPVFPLLLLATPTSRSRLHDSARSPTSPSHIMAPLLALPLPPCETQTRHAPSPTLVHPRLPVDLPSFLQRHSGTRKKTLDSVKQHQAAGGGGKPGMSEHETAKESVSHASAGGRGH